MNTKKKRSKSTLEEAVDRGRRAQAAVDQALAQRFVGKRVKFAHQVAEPQSHLVLCAVDGMIELEGWSGRFSPSGFLVERPLNFTGVDFVALSTREQTGPDLPGRNEWRRCAIELHLALEALVQLQAHYATLLNMHDGGERHAFTSAEEWLARMREMEAEEAK